MDPNEIELNEKDIKHLSAIGKQGTLLVNTRDNNLMDLPEEVEEDIEELNRAFNKFSEKYHEYIVGFSLYKFGHWKIRTCLSESMRPIKK